MDCCSLFDFLVILFLILHLLQALLEYEKHKKETGELQLPSSPLHQATSVEKEVKLFLFDCSISKIFYLLKKRESLEPVQNCSVLLNKSLACARTFAILN
jgi:hypothetical protein